MNKKSVRILISSILTLIFAGLGFYIGLPAINLQNKGFWMFLLSCIIFYFVFYFILSFRGEKIIKINVKKSSKKSKDKVEHGKKGIIAVCAVLVVIPILILLIGSFVSSTFFHANAYANLIEVPEANFADDMPEAEIVNNIALMDTDTAIKMGNRTLGALSNVVSQYEISESYRQINYKGAPQKISTLEYADFFKWFSNKSVGIPGYVMVDPVNVTEANYIELNKPIKYTHSGYFGDDLMRKLRFSYPTKMFGNCSFEIDDEGNPYYIIACMKPRIALFGASDVNEVIIFDPVSGSSSLHALTDVPAWVDNVFTGTLASQKYDWYGTLKNGFWNSVIGNKDCKVTTDDYGYIVIGDDVWFFTGVTSVVSDESNIGFIISNARTGEYKFYQVTGAEEYSAMSSAQGQVQEKGYTASFPSLINVSGEATYIMVLKDSAGLVKLYALVNVENYAIVATGSTQTEAKEEYLKLLKQNNIIDNLPNKDETHNPNVAEANIKIADIKVYTVGGESVFYITSSDGQIYSQKLCNEQRLLIIKVDDHINVKYRTDDADGGNGLVREIISFEFPIENMPSISEPTEQGAN